MKFTIHERFSDTTGGDVMRIASAERTTYGQSQALASSFLQDPR
jgi:hypothetical protein